MNESKYNIGEQGIALVFVALCLVAIFSVAAMVLDGGTMMRGQLGLQFALDSAAIRGSQVIYAGEEDMDEVSRVMVGGVEANLAAMGYQKSQIEEIVDGLNIVYRDASDEHVEGTVIELSSGVGVKTFFTTVLPGVASVQPVTAESASYQARTVDPFVPPDVILLGDASCSMWVHDVEPTEFEDENGDITVGDQRNHMLVGALQSFINFLPGGVYLSMHAYDKGSRTIWRDVISDNEFIGGDRGGLTKREDAFEASKYFLPTHNRCRTGQVSSIGYADYVVGYLKDTRPDRPKIIVLLTDGRATEKEANDYAGQFNNDEHPDFPGGSLKQEIDNFNGGACTYTESPNNNWDMYRGGTYSFLAMEWLKSRHPDVPVYVLAIGNPNANSTDPEVLASLANDPNAPDFMDHICVDGNQPWTVGTPEQGVEGGFFSVSSDLADRIVEVYNEVRYGSLPRRINNLDYVVTIRNLKRVEIDGGK